MQPLRTTLVPDQTISAAAGTDSWDLPPNPLSAILVTVRATNNTTGGTTPGGIISLINKLTNLDVKYRGATIFGASGQDALMLAMILQSWAPKQGQLNDADNETRSLTFPILFSKKYADARQCFPATRSGDLVLTADWDADPTSLDNYSLQIETLELLDATPESFIKVTSSARTMTAGIGNNLDLPIGNRILGALLRAATYPTGTSFNSSFGSMSLKVDNTEAYYSESNWETLQGELNRIVPAAWLYPTHNHTENIAATYTQFAATRGGNLDVPPAQQWAYLDFDPYGDQTGGIETEGAARIMIANNSDVADSADSYWLPIERVAVAGAPGA